MTSVSMALSLLLAVAAVAQSPQLTVVPAAYATTDANSYVWIPGASEQVREQTLVGSSHLQAAIGHDITAIEFRRTAADETYAGGTADLTVTLSTSPRTPLTCASDYASNVGPDAVTVFQGQVTLPTSPPEVGPAVAWSPNNVIRIPLQLPFRYLGGTLCVDITGSTVPGQSTAWWMADAVFEDIQGQSTPIGAGCGLFGGANGEWSFVSERSLLAGGHAKFWGYGPPGSFALAVFGAASPVSIPLTVFGIPTPGCEMHLQPNAISGSLFAVFVPEADPRLAHRGGRASIELPLPNQQWMLGASLSTQWFDLGQLATSNALRWTVASQMPSLDLALVDGHPQDTGGNVSVHLAHVLRFEHQAP